MKRTTVTTGISILLALVFLYTAIEKWFHFAIFKEQVAELPLATLIRWLIVFFLPAIEVLTAVLLAVPKWRQKGLALSIVLMGVFIVHVGYLALLDENLPCSCGGLFERLDKKTHLIVNLLLLGAGLAALIMQKEYVRQSRVLSKT